jgi:hypothetical protein
MSGKAHKLLPPEPAPGTSRGRFFLKDVGKRHQNLSPFWCRSNHSLSLKKSTSIRPRETFSLFALFFFLVEPLDEFTRLCRLVISSETTSG